MRVQETVIVILMSNLRMNCTDLLTTVCERYFSWKAKASQQERQKEVPCDVGGEVSVEPHGAHQAAGSGGVWVG